ncbi:MAG: hypothetical protein HYY16_12000 [Planctomycetes bacterium]|nr:hypothetical protein [Planctomycetota bacterium]
MIDDNFFPPPPRPRGRAWCRRLRNAVAWTLLAACVGGVMLAAALAQWNECRESMRLAASGTRVPCVVVGKRKIDRRPARYYVSLHRVDRPPTETIECRVSPSAWTRASAGQTSMCYIDPVTHRRLLEIERGYREDMAPTILMAVAGIVLAALGIRGLARNAREMSLLRHGIERVTFNRGTEVRVTHEGFSVAIQPPPDREKHIRVGPRGEELVVLARPDFSALLFPQVVDVPVERLVGAELLVPLLPSPVRPPNPHWSAWLRAEYRVIPAFMAVLAFAAGAMLIATATNLGFRSGFWAVLGAAALGEIALLLAWMRGYWRDTVLWREGDEVHAVVLDERWENGRRRYSIAFSYRGRENRGQRTLPEAFAALRTRNPEDAPAVTERAVVLVDPARPARWTLVPERCRRG